MIIYILAAIATFYLFKFLMKWFDNHGGLGGPNQWGEWF